jgi:hypothetical protein
VKDSVEYVWWFSKTEWPKSSNLNVLKGYSEDMLRLSRNGVRATVRPSGHVIRQSWDRVDAGGAIPSNILEESTAEADSLLRFGNNSANDEYTKLCKESGLTIHPARFPAALPSFFIRMLTEREDLIVDPFAGSNTTGAVAEGLDRRWVVSEQFKEYVEASKFRFRAAMEQPTLF